MDFSNLKEIKYHRLYESVIRELEKIIFEGELEPGSLLPTERKLSEDLGISRATLREAFRILEREGIITAKPGGGRYISTDLEKYKSKNEIATNIETATIMDSIAARKIVEVGIVELAAKMATEEDILEIQNSLEDWGKASENDMNSSDQTFHLNIAKATKNYILVSLMDYQMELLQKTKAKIGHRINRRDKIYEEHLAIFEAIKAKDPKRAKTALLNHLSAIEENIKKDIE